MRGFTFNERIINYAIDDEEMSCELYESTARRLNNGISPLLLKMAPPKL